MFQTKRVAAIAAGHAAHDTYTAFLPPLIPLFIPLLLLSKTEAGLLAVFLQLPWLFQPFIGHVADRTRPHLFVVLAPALSGVMMTLLGVAPSYGIMVIFLLLAGFSSASIHAADVRVIGLSLRAPSGGQQLVVGRALRTCIQSRPVPSCPARGSSARTHAACRRDSLC